MKTSVQDWLDFNDQLKAMARAGLTIPPAMELGSGGRQVSRTVDLITRIVQRRLSSGETLQAALQGDDGLIPDGYTRVVLAGIESGSLIQAYNEFHRDSVVSRDTNKVVRTAWAYPLLVLFLAMLGLVFATTVLLPVVQTTWSDLRLSPGRGLHLLEWLRATRPLWVGGLLIAIAASSLTLRGVSGPIRWLGLGGRREHSSWTARLSGIAWRERCAHFAETMAALLPTSASPVAAAHAAAIATNDAELGKLVAHALSPASATATFDNDASHSTQLPPMVHWALTVDPTRADLSRTLQMVARNYRTHIQAKTDALNRWLPIVTCIVVAGGAVTVYALAMLLPVWDLLLRLGN
ncbi:MAG: type II secretion system F family protein [Pirellulaceae bacterium]